MLPHIPADEALDRLRALPFVSAGPHGLLVHEAVRGPVTAALKSRDPARYQAYRRAASQVVRDQYRQAPRSDHWRCTADVLYLLENENLREGFFPTTESSVSVEPARADDWDSQFQRLFATSMDHSRVKRWSNGGTTIQTRFLSYEMSMAECKVSTRQLWHRRFTKM